MQLTQKEIFNMGKQKKNKKMEKRKETEKVNVDDETPLLPTTSTRKKANDIRESDGELYAWPAYKVTILDMLCILI